MVKNMGSSHLTFSSVKPEVMRTKQQTVSLKLIPLLDPPHDMKRCLKEKIKTENKHMTF